MRKIESGACRRWVRRVKRPAGRCTRIASLWLRVDRLLGEWGIQKDSPAGRRVFRQHLERRRLEKVDKTFQRLERGWFLGGEEFKQELLAQVDTAPSPSHFGELLHEAAEARAERLLREALARVGWTEQRLQARLKGDPHKIAIARQLRAQTTMSIAWIADDLQMGSRGYLAWLLQHRARAESDEHQSLLGI